MADADITLLLDQCRDDRSGGAAFQQLMTALYDELKRLARAQLRKGRPGDLGTTGLVHEAYLKLVGSKALDAENRAHLFSTMARVMRQIIVDYARQQGAKKRGGNQHHTMFEDERAPHGMGMFAGSGSWNPESILAIDEALGRISARDPRVVKVVECRFFAGLTGDETAEALELSPRTVQRDWLKGRSWLREYLGGEAAVPNEAG